MSERMRNDSPVALATVVAARAGDQRAMDDLVAGCLPLVYNIVGRALCGHADVDDVVQETMLRVVRGLGDLVEPASFRSWLVAVTMSQVRERHRSTPWQRVTGLPAPTGQDPADLDDLADPGADFVDLTILRLELTGQRQEVVRATRWLDAEDREVLSLWWLELAGALTRPELAGALGLTREHAAVTIQRTRARLEVARSVIRALDTMPRCQRLAAVVAGWDNRPSPLWRKRLARHIRECDACGRTPVGAVPADRLLAGLPLVPLPAGFAHLAGASSGMAGHAAGTAGGGSGAGGHAATGAHPVVGGGAAGGGGHAAGDVGGHLGAARFPVLKGLAAVKPLVAAVATVAVVATGAVAAATLGGGPERPAAARSAPAAPVVAAASPSAEPSLSPSAGPSPEASPAPSATSRAAVPPSAGSGKKGVSVWAFDGAAQALTDVRATWCYTWAVDHNGVTLPAGVEFVPMIWGANSVTQANLAKARSQGRQLLAFNEPDMDGQANMTVARALELWPQLQATGMRLGSPSVAYGADTPGGWLDQFMAGARAKGYRVDFITVHWYGSDFSSAATGQLKRYLQATYDRYHLPIWLTEYALIKFGPTTFPTGAQQAAFATASTTMLRGLPFVERYAWFALPSSKAGDTGLYTAGPKVTTVGAAYRAA